MTVSEIREQLAEIVIKGQARSAHPDTVITRPEARRIVTALIASDEAPEWNMVQAGGQQFRQVVTIVRARQLTNA